MVEGGAFDKMWSNSAYEGKLFRSGVTELNGERMYFPVAGTHEDPKGLACNMFVSGDGLRVDIQPNRFREWDVATRAGRRHQNYLDYLDFRQQKKEAFEKERKDLEKNQKMKKAVLRKV